MTKVFIDGSAGTTGLRIHDRLKNRNDIELITLSEEFRKDTAARKEALNSADIAFLCLPDGAAIEAVSLVTDKNTAIIDTSTAHRTNDGWAYGFSELRGYREKIKNSNRIANPGCHASGFIALVKPLIDEGFLKPHTALSCWSLTGYSGGGKKMIAEYEDKNRSPLLDAPRQYGLTQEHKHLKEMVKISGVDVAPAFCPIVAPFYSGMQVSVPLLKKDIKGDLNGIKNIYENYYNGGLVHFKSDANDSGFLSAAKYSGRDDMMLTLSGNEDRIILTAIYDNLGKGASGAAIQNMNILLGVKENTGLLEE